MRRSTPLLSLALLLLLSLLLALPPTALAVDRAKFRTCAQTSFCRRLRSAAFVLDPTTAAAAVSEAPDALLAQSTSTPAPTPLPATSGLVQQWFVAPESVAVQTEDAAQPHISALLRNKRHPLQPPLELTVSLLVNGVARVRVKESPAVEAQFGKRWEAAPHVLEPAGAAAADELQTTLQDTFAKVCTPALPTLASGAAAGAAENTCVVVEFRPFRVVLQRDGRSAVVMNAHGLFHMEQHRAKNPAPAPPPSSPVPAPAEGEAAASEAAPAVPPPAVPPPDPATQAFPFDGEGDWEEMFGSHSDTKPLGPAALSVDLQFVGAEHVYGIPEHASSLSLKTTAGPRAQYTDPYRLYNLDVFEYELDNPMALYGSVPFLLSHSLAAPAAPLAAGALLLNAAEMFVDVADGFLGSFADAHDDATGAAPTSFHAGKLAHFMVESGVVDLFLFAGPSPSAVAARYAALTGLPAAAPRFSVGYHQCRWNYKSEAEVAEVDADFDRYDIPYDTLWLDIEHTDEKKYFTWHPTLFKRPQEMQAALASRGRHMVTIVDPHIKRDTNYPVHTQITSANQYILNAAGKVYDGWCWPGAVSYPDFLRQDVRDTFAGFYALDKYEGSTPTLHIWNDMNEPSVFNGPEVSMQKDCRHFDGTVEHRDVHNLYGASYHASTAEGLLRRQQSPAVAAAAAAPVAPSSLVLTPGAAQPAQRPFVLSRAFFAGSQKHGAIWTGDNTASFDHLAVATPMLLSLSLAGIPFVGADVGGFFLDVQGPLLTRWYQAAAFTPFFRGHGHIDTQRREPWVYGEPHTSRMRAAIRSRYVYLSYIYSQFFVANVTGVAPLRSLSQQFPRDPALLADQESFMMGPDVLVRPIVVDNSPDVISILLPLQSDQRTGKLVPTVWYHLDTHKAFLVDPASAADVAVAPATSTADVAGAVAALAGAGASTRVPAGRYSRYEGAADMSRIPVFQRGGSVVPQQLRARRSSAAMTADPYSLSVALPPAAALAASAEATAPPAAEGLLYIDDGTTFGFREGKYMVRLFSFRAVTPAQAGAAGVPGAAFRLDSRRATGRPGVARTGALAFVAGAEGEEDGLLRMPGQLPPPSATVTAENAVERIQFVGLPADALPLLDHALLSVHGALASEPVRIPLGRARDAPEVLVLSRLPALRLDQDFTLWLIAKQ